MNDCDRRRELARATAHREEAEQALAAHQSSTGRQPAGMLGWLRRGHEQPAGMPGGLAVATQQANRAHDLEAWPARPRGYRLAARGGRGAAHRSAARPPGAAGWAVLRDLALPGSPANLDHLVIGPGGVFVVDSKQYRGRLQLDPSGRLWHGRYPLTPILRALSFEADQAAQILADPQVVVPIVAVHGAQVPWGKVVVDGVPVVPARRLPGMLPALPAVLGPERVADLAARARVRFHAAA